MSLRSAGSQLLETAPSPLLRGASTASISIWVRVNPGSAVVDPAGVQLFGDTGGRLAVGLTVSGRLLVDWSSNDGVAGHASGWAQGLPAVPGVNYHIAATWRDGAQHYYVNGLLVHSDTQPGTLGRLGDGSSYPFRLGSSLAGVDVTIDEPTLWVGYELTPSDVVNLRDRAALPSTIAPASVALRWSLAGPDGGTATPGTPGLVDGSTTGLNLTSVVGGTPSYQSGDLAYSLLGNGCSAFVAPSGQSIVFEFHDEATDPINVASVVSNNEEQSIVIIGRPAGDSITLGFKGQSTAPIPTIPSPPAAFFQWNKADLTPGTYDLQVNIFPGGTQSATMDYEVFDGPTSLGTFTLNHATNSGNPAPVFDPVLTQRSFGSGNGVPISRYPIGRYTFATSSLHVRVSCPATPGDHNWIDADCLWIVNTSGVDVVRLLPAIPPCTFATGPLPYFNDPQGYQPLGDPVNMFVTTGTGVGLRYLVDPAVVQSSLETLSTIGVGNVTVTGDGSSLSPLIVTFRNVLGDTAQPLMTCTPLDGTIAVDHYAVGGILPAIRINGGSAIQLTRAMLYYNSLRPTMPTAQFFLPQYLPDVFKYAVANQYDNGLSGPGWRTAFDGGPAGGVFGYTQQVLNSSGSGAAASYFYRPTPPGVYRVSATWPANPGFSTDVVYVVNDLDGNTLGTYHVNQTATPPDDLDGGVTWKILGTFTLGTSTNGGLFNGLVVTQTNATGSVMMADAVRFERISLATPTVTIAPGDAVTYTAGNGWMTSLTGPAPAATDVAVDNRSGGTFYTPSTAPTTMKVGWNLPAMASLGPAYYTNKLYNTDAMEQYPTVIGNFSASVQICDSPTTFGGDRKGAPTTRAGNYDLKWKGASDATLGTGIYNGAIEDGSRAIFPGVDGDGYHRRTYALNSGAFNYGTKFDLIIHGTTPTGVGSNYNADINSVWIVPKDTDVATAPKYDAVFSSNIHGIRTMRHLDGLAAIEGNCTDFSDYMKPQSHTSRNIQPRNLSFSLADNPVTIRDYVYNPAHFPHDFTRLFGAAALFTFTNPHGLSNGMIFRIDNYTGDDALVTSDIGIIPDNLPGTHPLLVHYIDDHNFVSVIQNTRGYAPEHMTNVIANAGGLIICLAGAGTTLQDLVEINNAAGADFYFNTHFCNTDACLTAIGAYMAANLAPGLKFRVECANEIWNFLSTPCIWAEQRSQVIYGKGANDYTTFYCETAHHHHTLIKAAWVAGGRDPNDFRAIIGGQTADPGVAQNFAAYYASQASRGWTLFDELVTTNYLTNTPSFAAPSFSPEYPFYKVVDGMTPDQHLDMWEVHHKYGLYEAEVGAQKDAMVRGGGPGFAGVSVGFYEGGPDNLLLQRGGPAPYGPPNEGYRNHAGQRHPRYYGILLDNLRTCNDAGATFSNFFVYQGSENGSFPAWGAIRSQGELPYAPGDPVQDAIQIHQVDRQDLHKSITAGAIRAFASLYGAAVPPPPPATASLRGPATGTAGVASAPFTVTLGAAAPAGGQAVTLADSSGGNAFAGPHVAGATLTIPSGSIADTFTYTRSTAGTSSISIAATGLTILGSPIAYVASASPPPPPPTRATLAPTPTACTVGAESSAIVVTLDATAPAGGTVVNLASTGSRDVFHGAIGGGPVASIAIAPGSATGRFYLVAGTSGPRNVSIASAGLTVVGSPRTITATTPPPRTPTRATLAPRPTACTVGVESEAIIVTLDAPAPSGGTVVSLRSTGSRDVFHGAIGGGPVASITIAPGSATGRFYLVAGPAGPRNISITSAGLTVVGSPLTITARVKRPRFVPWRR